jgi:glycosyltransferase involved in cell wall biosynthesis
MPWYSKYLTVFEKPFIDAPAVVVEDVRRKLLQMQSENPIASIVVIAHNEERRLLSCLWSLSDNITSFPIEFIGVDNNSIDNTAEIFKNLGFRTYIEPQKGAGFARACGLFHARGRYYLSMDADTLYPPYYIETMIKSFVKPEIVGACSLLSIMPNNQNSRFGLCIYEFFRDIHIRVQFYKRPELSARGAASAFQVECGRKVGYRGDLLRGEDGSMVLGLKKYGKIKLITIRKARALTPVNFSESDKSLLRRFLRLTIQSLRKFSTYFTKKEYYEDDPSNINNV